MKRKGIFLLLTVLLSLFCLHTKAQTVQFTYDAAGNRISGKTIMLLRTALEEDDDEPEEELPVYSEFMGDRIIRIYPNPTQGLLKVDIENLLKGETATISIYDMSGKQIVSKEASSFSTEMDITGHPEGVYILRIVIGDYHSEWKVIKQ